MVEQFRKCPGAVKNVQGNNTRTGALDGQEGDAPAGMIFHHDPDALSGADSLIPQEPSDLVHFLGDSAVGEGFPVVTGNVLKGRVIRPAIPVFGQFLEKIQSHRFYEARHLA